MKFLDSGGNIIATITPPVGTVGISGFFYNPNNNRVYVGCDTGTPTDIMCIIDCQNNTIITNITILNSFVYFGYQTSSAFVSSTNTFYYIVTNGISYRIQSFDCNNNAVLNIFTSSPVNLYTFLIYSPINNSLYSGKTGAFLNCISLTTLTSSPVPVSYKPYSALYINNLLYVGVNDSAGTTKFDLVNPTTNTVINSIFLSPTISDDISSTTYNSLSNVIYISDSFNNEISVFDIASNSISQTVQTTTISSPQLITYNPLNNSNIIYGFGVPYNSLFLATPVIIPFISGSPTYNYNTFIQDKASNPFLVNSVMLYSDNPSNLNQVFFATVKDATGEITYDPKLPALDISVNQFQASVTYVDFGKKGFVFNEQSSFSDFTVQPFSSVRIVLIQKQFNSNSEFTNPKSNMDAIINDIGLYPIPNPDKTKIVRDSVRAVPLNTPTPTPAPKPTKKKKPLKPNKCAELWKDNYGIDGSEEINLQNQKSEILGLPTKFVVGLGVGLLAVVGSIIIYKTK